MWRCTSWSPEYAASCLLGFHALRDLYRFLRLQLSRHSLDSSCLFCNGGLLFPDLLALRIVRFAKIVHVEGETLHLRCNGAYPFCKETQLCPFFLHRWCPFGHRLQDTKCANQEGWCISKAPMWFASLEPRSCSDAAVRVISCIPTVSYPLLLYNLPVSYPNVWLHAWSLPLLSWKYYCSAPFLAFLAPLLHAQFGARS